MDAEAALSTARAALSAARAQPPVPRWLPPAAGLLCATGFVCLGLAVLDLDRGGWLFLVVGIGCLVALLAVAAVGRRVGGLVPWPSGTMRERWARQLTGLIPVAAGWVAAALFGLAECLIVFGVGSGILLWTQLARSRRGVSS